MAAPSALQYFWDSQAVSLPLLFGRLLPLLSYADTDMSDKNVIITGGNSGLGYAMAAQLAALNANIFLACRNPQKAEDARAGLLKRNPDAKVHCLALDTASFKSVREFAAGWSYGKIDVLLHNAGIAVLPDEMTEDGFEMMYQTNFLSTFLLTFLLLAHLSSSARVVLTSSMGAYSGKISDRFDLSRVTEEVEIGFHTVDVKLPGTDSNRYFNTKLMQAAFARALQVHFDKDPANTRLAFSWEPGVVATNIQAQIGGISWKKDIPWYIINVCMNFAAISVDQGAATGVLVAVSEDETVKSAKGRYFSRNVRRISPADFYSQEKLDRLWIRWSADAGIEWT